MSDNVVYGVDFKAKVGLTPEFLEACQTAKALHAAFSKNGKCAASDCDNDGQGCTHSGCLMEGMGADQPA